MSCAELHQLEALLVGGTDHEHTYAMSESFYEPSLADVDEVQDDFYAKYEALVSSIAAHWGPPDFSDGMGHPSFPQWYEAEFLTTWERGGRIAYVALRHDDQELPFAVVYGVRSGVRASRPTKARRNLDSEANNLTALIHGKALQHARLPSKSTLVLSFTDGSFLVIEGPGGSLKLRSGSRGLA